MGCGGPSPSVGPHSSELSASPAATRDPTSPYGTTREEFLLATKACVEAKGFPVTLDVADGRFSFSLGSDERARQAKVALSDCEAEVDPARSEPAPALTDTQLRAWYAYRLLQVKCLRDAGYPPPEAPPEQVFVDTAGKWDPFEALIQAGTMPSQADMLRCQQLTEGRPNFLTW